MLERFNELLQQISYKPGWKFRVHRKAEDVYYLQVEIPTCWKGRKWLLSRFMTDSEFFQTALLAVLQAEEHEAREAFEVNGCAVFGPHLNVYHRIELDTRAPKEIS